jgi:hypothetical protein
VLISTGRGLFIGVQGGVTNLVKLVTHQMVAGWPSHMAEHPRAPASNDFQLQNSYYRLFESVTVKLTCERLQNGAARAGCLVGQRPPRATSQGPLYTTSSCQVHSRGDTYFGVIPNFLVIS